MRIRDASRDYWRQDAKMDERMMDVRGWRERGSEAEE
jgi:hypothetical protein